MRDRAFDEAWKMIGEYYVGPHEEGGLSYGGHVVLMQLPKVGKKRGPKPKGDPEPWKAEGVSRHTYFRRQKQKREE